ncbi:MAG: 4Fe-4S dicluster domain-containing protein [Sedimentisphaerales bacterium]|nr:4Fe-4S dicluster domain-containing protein [Sedimentisphaerales bacterium]
MATKLIIDLVKCKPQRESGVQCSYKKHPQNKGFDSLLELIRFALICRRCEEAPCVKACPHGALEKVPNEKGGLVDRMLLVSTGPRGALEKVPKDNFHADIIKRSNILCTGCGSCAIACPFGTIYNNLIQYPSGECDLCKGRLEPGEKPLCVTTCEDGSLDYQDVHADDTEDVFEDIVVKVSGVGLWETFLSNK